MKKKLKVLILTVFAALVLFSATGYAGTDDYPYKKASTKAVDPWNFYYRQCTSFVAWRLNSRNGIHFTNQYMGISRMNHAKYWGPNAMSLGIVVDMNPTVGSVAWSSSGEYGHVAWVEAVNKDNGTVTIEEYNYKSLAYSERTVPVSSFNGYIHFKDLHDIKVTMSRNKQTVTVGDTLTIYTGELITIYGVADTGQVAVMKAANKDIVTAIDMFMKGQKRGSTKVTFTFRDPVYKGIYTKTITVNVVDPSIKLSRSSLNLDQYKAVTLKATVAGPSNKVKWKSSKSSVVSVNSLGLIYAKKAGTAVISATANGKTAKCKVRVKKVSYIKMIHERYGLQVGKSVKLGYNSVGLSGSAKWSSSNKKVATVKNGVVKAVSPGTAVITVKRGGKKATCTVTVIGASNQVAAKAKKAYQSYLKDRGSIFTASWVKDYTGDGIPDLLAKNRYGKYFLNTYYEKAAAQGYAFGVVPIADGDTIAVNRAKKYAISYNYFYGNRYVPMLKRTLYNVGIDTWSVTTFLKYPNMYKRYVYEHYSNGYFYTLQAPTYRNVNYNDARDTTKDLQSKSVQNFYSGTVMITPTGSSAGSSTVVYNK